MKVNLKNLKNKIQGDVLATTEHRSNVLTEETLRTINGGAMPNSVSCCPSADDSVD